MKKRVGIWGVTGYAGVELLRLLMAHDGVEVTHLVSSSHVGTPLDALYPHLSGACLPPLSGPDTQMAAEADIVFTSLPHGASFDTVPKLLEAGTRVIDLSGDFRYDDARVYAEWYGLEHPCPALLQESVYGLCELNRDAIRNARLVGNPGCYPTASILALAPLLKDGLVREESVIIDAKSGATGAGRQLSQPLHFCETDENFKAYNVAKHRHTSEIEQELGKLAGKRVALSFAPHLLPLQRGILATCYADLVKPVSATALLTLYQAFYANEPFVYIYNSGLPELKHVARSNRCGIGLTVDERVGRVIVISCIDNIIKGAGGQAVQNMNIMLGFEESRGLPITGTYF